MRTLAIDLGTRRIGLALSDAGGKFATPFEVLEVQSADSAIESVADIVRREGVERLVVGLPLNMDGTTGPAAREAVAWGRRLAETSATPIVFIDERLSSFEAEEQISSRRRGGERITHKGKKQRLDALAAANFLQAFLDGRLPAIENQ